MPRLTDEQVKVLADWEEGGPAWYRAECFKTDIQEERNEFDLLRDLALDHADLTAALKVACEALEDMKAWHTDAVKCDECCVCVSRDFPRGDLDAALASIERILGGGK
jgi:hypothetical protein